MARRLQGGVDIMDRLPQFSIAAPFADQQEGKAGAALVQKGKARAILDQVCAEIVQCGLGEGACFGRYSGAGFIKVVLV